MTLHDLLSKIPAPLKTALRAAVGLAAFAALKDLTGGGTVEHALDVALAAATPVLLKWLDPTSGAEADYGQSAAPQD